MIIRSAHATGRACLAIGLTVGVATCALAIAFAAEAGTAHQGQAQAAEHLWPAQATVAGSGDEVVDMLVGLAQIDGRLQVGMDLFQQGNTEAAQSHFQAVADTLFPAFAARFADRRMPAMPDALADLAILGEPAEMAQKYLTVRKAMADATIALQADASQQFMAIAIEVETVANALDAGVTGGRVTDPVAFQSAWGLVLAASANASQLASAKEASLRTSGSKAALMLDDLVIALPEANPSVPVELSSITVRDIAMKIKRMAATVAYQQSTATN
ncbi:MAG: hypothetical protein R3D56_03505 [Paracoccaceae bacterium]